MGKKTLTDGGVTGLGIVGDVVAVAAIGGAAYGVVKLLSSKDNRTPAQKEADSQAAAVQNWPTPTSSTEASYQASERARITQQQNLAYNIKPATVNIGNNTKSSDGGIKIDPTFLRSKPQDVYAKVYSSYQDGIANGTNQTVAISQGQWTKKITTDDGSVIYKDDKGNMTTKDESGNWLIFNSEAEFVQAQAPKTQSVAFSQVQANTVSFK